MRKSNWTPSIVPSGDDQTVYLVAEDFGRLGRACIQKNLADKARKLGIPVWKFGNGGA